MRIRRRHKAAVEQARREREFSRERLVEATRIARQLDRISEENHLAEAIINGILRGHRA